MDLSDTAATLQQQYDEAVYLHGPDSIEAFDAWSEAQQFFKGTPTPEKVGIQPLKESIT